MSNLASLGVDMVNVHAQGTIEMMKAARRGLDAGYEKYADKSNSCENGDESRPVLIAVTQLTSTSEQDMHKDLLIERTMAETVLHYGENAKKAGLDGVVCSPHEAEIIHAKCGKTFLTVTPGIRFEGAQKDDQVRITTPERAKEIGCDFIVVGRPITKSDDPVKAYKMCLEDFGIKLDEKLSQSGKNSNCDVKRRTKYQKIFPAKSLKDFLKFRLYFYDPKSLLHGLRELKAQYTVIIV